MRRKMIKGDIWIPQVVKLGVPVLHLKREIVDVTEKTVAYKRGEKSKVDSCLIETFEKWIRRYGAEL